MPESQLKRLKASLRTAGITGQQKSKKAAKKQRQSTTKNDSRLDRNATLQTIREEFNPFEIKTTKEKHAVIGRGKIKGAQGRPGLSKQIGEENRKRTLLVEMQKRNKAGGILDRRFGENDPTMTPEEKMLERFTKEKQKRVRGGDIFNLDDDDELTHFGQSLGGLADDFDAQNDLMLSDDEPTRKRPLDTEASDDEEASPEHKKSKAEVMKEVIAKSKLHKYERQKAKEDDDEEREKLDAQMNDIWALLGSKKPPTTGPATGANNEPVPGREEVKAKPEADSSINPERLARMEGRQYDYDVAVREMAFDKRSKPSERTKTEEEKLQEESERLKKLEEARQKRMRGEEDSGDEREAPGGDDEVDFGDAAEYGLGAGIPMAPVGGNINPDELVDGDYEVSEDGYIDVDENGEVNASNAEHSDDYTSDYSGAGGSDDELEEDEDDDFLEVLGNKPGKTGTKTAVLDLSKVDDKDNKLAFTFPCPQTHEEFQEIVKGIPIEDLPTVVQRIRVLYHPKLDAENKHKLARFSEILLQHILLVANKSPSAPPFKPLETLIRHLHALAKSYPDTVSRAFREHLNTIHEERSTEDLRAGDLILFTAISTIFPTSDHFHQVVTPAMIVICQWLGQAFPNSLSRLGMGTYLVTMCVQYQRLSKRYVPEATHFILRALSLLAPAKQEKLPGSFPYEEPEVSLRIQKPSQKETVEVRKMNFADVFNAEDKNGADRRDIQLSLLTTLASLLESMADLWVGKTAFTMIFEPALEVIEHLLHKSNKSAIGSAHREKLLATKSALESHLLHARKTLRPLTLHYHRPLPIKTYIPKFEETYSLDKRSYDPDADRVALSKLKAEHKREKKGALRELRKDSRFIAREKLKEDKKTSKEYHEKMRKLTAMIQTEEGAAANEYKRAKGRK
ncbi:Nop14-like protein [Choiromyces venosus 120613-1]|uniref:Nop14-like protein n=1 Tax=Choiromyces venosus 120613-1 TaxID=1336337 RepID=A0A3N4JCW2_9PEZI|nr:Nop14-like protein [Choiromyces venosus 120613-1]